MNYKDNVNLDDSEKSKFGEEFKASNIENNETISMKDTELYEEEANYGRKQNASSQPLGVMDSIVQELTSVRLQQAIILSEIVGKPRSKTRRTRKKGRV